MIERVMSRERSCQREYPVAEDYRAKLKSVARTRARKRERIVLPRMQAVPGDTPIAPTGRYTPGRD